MSILMIRPTYPIRLGTVVRILEFTITAAAKVASVSGLVEYSRDLEGNGSRLASSRRQEADPMDMENTNLRLGPSMDVGERHG